MSGYDGRGRKFPLVLVRGTDVAFQLTVTSAGSPVDMSAATITASIFTNAGVLVDSFTSAVSGAGSNIVTLSLTDAETALLLSSTYRWSLVVTRGGDVRTWLAGTVRVTDSDEGGASTSGNIDVSTSLDEVLTVDGDILTRTAGVPARITRAALAADEAWSDLYAPSVPQAMTVYETTARPFLRVVFQTGATLYAVHQTTLGQVWKSTDSGASWTALAGSLSGDVSALHRVGATGTLIAVGVNASPWVKRSIDDGATWSTSTTLNFGTLGNQGVCVTPSGAILIGEYGNTGSTVYRIMRSVDDGATFSAVLSSPGTDGASDPGHIHSVTYDTFDDKLVAFMDRTSPEVYASSDNGATWQLVGTVTLASHPNFVAPMFFENYVAWGVDNTDNGRIYRLPRADFYAGAWSSPELVAQLNRKVFYDTFPIRPDVWVISGATEAVGGDALGSGSYAQEVFIVSGDGGTVAGGVSHASISVTVNSLLGQRAQLPGYPYDSTGSSGRSWINLNAVGGPSAYVAVAYSVGQAPPMPHTINGASHYFVTPNNAGYAARDTSDVIRLVMQMDTTNRVRVVNNQASPVPELRLYEGASSTIAFLFDGALAFSLNAAEVRLHGRVLSSGASLTSAYIRWGTGAPEGSVTAPVGSLFMRTDGGASTTMYVKESGTGNTGWVAK